MTKKSIILKLTDDQFETSKVKMQKVKLWNPPLADSSMKFKSVRDILRFAVAKEESSVQFYRSLSKCVKKSETAAVFEVMARQEEKHIDAVQLELLKLGYTVADSTISEDASEDSGITLEVDDTAAEMTYLDALRLGIQKERAAFKLYAELMALAEDETSRKVFLELAEEEVRHALKLEREIEVLSQHSKD